jgi:glycine oxidase
VKSYDVVVVGGGLIGTSIAFELAAQKLRVALLDRQQPGREASWAAAGMLSPGPDAPEALPLVPMARESLLLYPDFVSSIEEASGKQVAFARQGAFQIFNDPDGAAKRDRLLAHYSELGLAAEFISTESARAVEPSLNPDANAIAWLSNEATVDPRLLIDAALAAAKNRGVEIFISHAVASVLAESGRCTGVVVGGQKMAATYVVIAAGSFCAGIGEDAVQGAIGIAGYAPAHPVRGQMMALRSNKVKLQKVLRSERGYIVPRADGRIIAGSTIENVGFAKNTTQEGLRTIFDAAIALAPDLAEAEIVETWAGLRPGTPDHLPIIGPTDIPGLLIATGHYRNGILLAPVTAKLIGDWIVEGKARFGADRFSPLRFAAAISRGTAAKSAPATP